MKRWIGFLLGTAVLCVPAWAFACTVLRCEDTTKISAVEFGMPANTPSIVMDPDFAGLSNDPLVLEEVDGEEIPYTMRNWGQGWEIITPSTPFKPNTSYLLSRGLTEEPLEEDLGCNHTLKLPFTTGAVEEFPGSVGTLRAHEVRKDAIGIDTDDGCSDMVDVAYADVELDLSEDAQVWHGGLIMQTYINGKPWLASSAYLETYKPGETWMGYGKDRIFVICDERYSGSRLKTLQGGSYKVKMVGSIPGTPVQVESNTITLDLYCSPPADGCSAAGGAPFALSLLILGALRRRKRG